MNENSKEKGQKMPENLIDGSVYATTAEVMTSTKIEDPVYFGANTLVCGGSKIGRFTILNREVSVYTTEIGRFCSIGEKTVIGANQHPIEYLSTHPFHSSNIHFGFLPEYKNIERIPFDDWAAPTEIGSDVWIGTHVVINTGISVGHGAVLGAGAIVTKDIPPYAIAVGSPARILRYRFSEDIIAALLELKWWELDLSLIRSLTFDDIRTCIDELRHIRAQHPVS